MCGDLLQVARAVLCGAHCSSKECICCQLLVATFYVENLHKSSRKTFFTGIHSAACIAQCNTVTHPGLQAQVKKKKHKKQDEAPEGCLSGLEVSLLLPGSQLVLKGHALRALPPAEAHVTHSQHNSPQGQVPGIVCLPCQPFSAALHYQAINQIVSFSSLSCVYNSSLQK